MLLIYPRNLKIMIIFKNRNGKEQMKPEAIWNYNRFMSGIDRQDQMNSYYPFTRKTIRWYKKIGIHRYSNDVDEFILFI